VPGTWIAQLSMLCRHSTCVRGEKAMAMSDKSPLVEYRLTDHAQLEIKRRQISEAEVARVLAAPQQMEEVRPGRVVYQSRVEFGAPSRIYLLRVFVDIDRRPPEVVTAYRTSQVEKYWKEES
jgi:hypothetical protein